MTEREAGAPLTSRTGLRVEAGCRRHDAVDGVVPALYSVESPMTVVRPVPPPRPRWPRAVVESGPLGRPAAGAMSGAVSGATEEAAGRPVVLTLVDGSERPAAASTPTVVAVVDLEAPDRLRHPLGAPADEPCRTRLVLRRDGYPLGAVDTDTVDGTVRAGTVAAAAQALGAAPARFLPPPSGAGLTVSVVVVTRDRPAALVRCLAALLASTDRDLEVLVVDSAPRTDLTRRAVHGIEDPRLRYLLEERAGAGVARNRGVAQTHGDVVAFVGDDVVVDDRWLGCVRAAVAGGAQAVAGPVLAGRLETAEQHAADRRLPWAALWQPRRLRDGDLGVLRALVVAGHPQASSLAVTRTTLRAVGPFDELLGADAAVRAGEDLDYLERVQAGGSDVAYEPAALAWRLAGADARSVAQARQDAARGLGAVLAKAVAERRIPRRATPAAVWSALRSSPAVRATVAGAWTYLRAR